MAPQGFNVPGCADPHATDAHRSLLWRAADKAAAAWVARAAAKEWDTIQADLSVYRFCGETYTADPRRTPEYRTTILAALQLADPAAAATRYPDLSTADLAALRETVIRCAAAFWVEGTPRTTVRHMAHDTIPTGPPVRTPPHRLNGTDAQWIED